jgi:hypothetical protein
VEHSNHKLIQPEKDDFMKGTSFRIITLGLLLLSLATARAQGLRLENFWYLAPADRPYLTTSTSQRGLSYNPVTGHLILVNRSGGISVQVIDALTGNDVSSMDTSGLINPGTFILSKVGVADDGVIYGANFGTIGGGTPTFTVYRWQDEASVATIAYSSDPGAGNIQQWGTTFDVRGTGTNTQILVSSSTGTIAALLTTLDGTNFTSQVIATDVLPGQMGIGIAFGTNNTFWAKSVDGPLLHLSFDPIAGTATTLQSFSVTNFPGSVAPFAVDVTNNLLVGINITTPDTANLYTITNLAAAPVLLSSTNLPSDYANTLFMGAVDFGGGMVFTLDSNNGLQAYSLVPSSDPVPPSIVLHPQSQTVFAGSTATFVASAAGSGTLFYQWRTNSIDIPRATNAVLTLTNVQAANEADYDVVVSNVAATASSFIAHLTVLPPGVMTPLWSLAPGSRSYLTSTSNNQRGMAYNPVTKHLLLVNMAGTVSVNVLAAVTGANIGTLATNGIAGGTFRLLMIGVADDGVIYAANFGTYNASATPPVITTVYRWSDENALPTIAFQGDPTGGIQNRQWGNALDVRGSGTNTQILLPSGGQQYVSILTTANGTNFSSVLISNVPTSAVLEGAAFGAGNSFWGKSSAGATLVHFGYDFTNYAATVLEAYDSTLFDATVNPIAVDPVHNLLAGVSIATPDNIQLYDISKLTPTQGPVLLQAVKAPTDNANTLFRGALDFGDGMLFALDTNNGLSAFALPFLRVNLVNANVVVSWATNLVGFSLQSTTNITSGVWAPVSGAVVSGDRQNVTLAPATSPQFFRLKK